MNKDQIAEILTNQYFKMKDENFSGFDLCDITSKPYFLWVNKVSHGKRWGKYIKYPHDLFLDKFSKPIRKALNIRQQDFAQSNAFIVRGLLRLWKYTGEKIFLDDAGSLIRRVINQQSQGYSYAAWGQPYDWFSGIIIPAFTPRTTVTSQIGRMFLDAFAFTKNDHYLKIAMEIGEFFLHEMPLSFDDGDNTCFSYTTLDQHQVHNPNMMASSFLAFLWKETDDDRYLKRSKSAANFTFSHINVDGSWYYSSLPGNLPSKIDNYHTGYNIEAALGIQSCWPDFPHEHLLKKSIEYYKKALFDSQGIPFLTNKKRFPVDIQCCAQSIITKSVLADPKNEAKGLFEWTHSNMYEKGKYYYRIHKNGRKDTTSFIRWGDAWMFFAGSLLLAGK